MYETKCIVRYCKVEKHQSKMLQRYNKRQLSLQHHLRANIRAENNRAPEQPVNFS